MPRINQGTVLSQEWNALVLRARELGISGLREISMANGVGGHVSRATLRARIEALRGQIASFNLPTSIAAMGRTFGVEFEFMLPMGRTRQELTAYLVNAGLDARLESWNHTTRTWWKVTTDGSLGYARGTEVVSPILSGEAGFAAVRSVANALKNFGCKVTSSCGFHVHVGVASEHLGFFKNILRTYRRFEPVINQLLAPSRTNNRWCASVRFSDAIMNATSISELQRDMSFRNKYVKLNMASFANRGTVEFRQHQGTVEARKAEMWIRLCLRMVAAASAKTAEQLTTVELSLAGLMAAVDAEPAEADYFKERHERFAARRLP